MTDVELALMGQNGLNNIIKSEEYFSDNADSFESRRLKSTTTAATYSKLIELIGKIINLTNESRERPIGFMSYSSYRKTEDIAVPIVIYRTHKRSPQKEIKPRFRETINDASNPNKTINVYGQKFDYIVEFNIIDSTDENAEYTMYELEDIMLTYAGYFMSQGVSNIRLLEQTQDESVTLKEECFKKTVFYSVTLERITLVSDEKIQTIISRI